MPVTKKQRREDRMDKMVTHSIVEGLATGRECRVEVTLSLGGQENRAGAIRQIKRCSEGSELSSRMGSTAATWPVCKASRLPGAGQRSRSSWNEGLELRWEVRL